MILKIVMWYLHIRYKKQKDDILYIKGTGKQYPRYLLYTENEKVYKRMDDF